MLGGQNSKENSKSGCIIHDFLEAPAIANKIQKKIASKRNNIASTVKWNIDKIQKKIARLRVKTSTTRTRRLLPGQNSKENSKLLLWCLMPSLQLLLAYKIQKKIASLVHNLARIHRRPSWWYKIQKKIASRYFLTLYIIPSILSIQNSKENSKFAGVLWCCWEVLGCKTKFKRK